MHLYMDAVKLLLLLTEVGSLLKDVLCDTPLLLVDYWHSMEEKIFINEEGIQV